MFRFEAPATRRLRRQATRRTRWELGLLALAAGHWAYHKNREWNLVVKDLVASRAGDLFFDAADPEGRPMTAPARAIDLTSSDDTLDVPAPR